MTSSGSASSRDRILSLLLYGEEGVTVPEMAKHLGISRNATHQHVTALERDGLVELSGLVQTGGRPSQSYRLSQQGQAIFPRQYALLSAKLVAELSALLDEDALRDTLRRVGLSLAIDLSDKVDREASDVVVQINDLMQKLGYETMLEGPAQDPKIVAHNCVFHDLAMENPAICEIDLELLRSLSGGEVDQSECMALGGKACRFGFARGER